MEKITVRIGHVGKGSSLSHKFSRSFNDDILWLRKVLDISSKRAATLVTRLRHDSTPQGASTSCYAMLALNYEQLARYVIMRKKDDLIEYWKYPQIEDFEEEPEPNPTLPIELRPGRRSQH